MSCCRRWQLKSNVVSLGRELAQGVVGKAMVVQVDLILIGVSETSGQK